MPRKQGATVMVVAGKFSGRVGHLLHRSGDYAALQLEDEHDVQKLHLDDFAEYRGSNHM